MKRSASLIILVAGTLFASCSSLQTISFDQLQAADVSFPDAVRKVAVINNMPVLKTKDNHEILSSELEGDGKVASEALAENIANVNYFDQVIICDSVFRAQDKVPRVNVILTKEEVRKLSEDLGVDMILSFDRIHIQTKPGVLFYPDFPMPIDAVDGIISPIVRVYIPNRDKPLFVVAKQDTISWEIEPALSDRKIVKEASEYAASIPVEHLLPHWDEVARFYYDGGNIEMRDAGVYLRENNWDEAYSQWKIAYEKRKGQQKMKAAFNIALYYEIKDNAKELKKKLQEKMKHLHEGGCPGSRMRMLEQPETAAESAVAAPVQPVSRLRNWPVQIKLAPIHAPYFEGAKLLIAADCTAYAYANFHQEFMRGKVTLIGCPKLDAVDYSEKLTEILRSNDIQSVTILRMEVPCCGGLEMAAKKALQTSGKFIPWQVVTISIDGKILD